MIKKEWIDWLKCNVLEIIILIVVLMLLVKVFSAPAPAVQDVSDVTIEKPVVLNEIPTGEPLIEETPAEIVVAEEAPTK